MKRVVTLLTCSIFALLLLASCGNAGGDSPASISAPGAAPPGGMAMAPPDGIHAGQAQTAESGAGLADIPILAPSQAGGKRLAYTVTLRLQTTEFMEGYRTLLDTTNLLRGYPTRVEVHGRDMRGAETERRADFALRIPVERLHEFLKMLEDNYNLWDLTLTAADHTIGDRSADLRTADLFGQERRLIESLLLAEDTEDRLDIERRLSEVQSAINDLLTRQMRTDDEVRYSTAMIQLYEVILPEDCEECGECEECFEEPPVTFRERVSDRTSRSIDAFVAFCQGLLLAVIAIAPVLVVIAVFGAIALVIIVIVNKRDKKSKQKPAVNDESDEQ
jgi:hypothetical protein